MRKDCIMRGAPRRIAASKPALKEMRMVEAERQ
jgi:hypothetical protein